MLEDSYGQDRRRYVGAMNREPHYPPVLVVLSGTPPKLESKGPWDMLDESNIPRR